MDYTGNRRLVELYKFTLIDGTIKYFTSYHDSITWTEDAQTYVPAPIMRGGRSKSFKISPSSITVTIAASDTYFDMDEVKNRKLLDNCELIVYRVDLDDHSNYAQILSGTVGDISTAETVLQLKIQDEASTLKKRIPRRHYSANCEHVFCSTDCGLVLADLKETGTADAGGDTDTIVDAERAEDAGYFNGGYVEITSGDCDGEKRMVKTYTVGNIELLVPFTAAIGAGITYDIYPHCENTWAKCDALGNTDNNGAFKNIPKPEEVYT